MAGRLVKQLPNWATIGIGALIAIALGYLAISALTGGDENSGESPAIELPANITGSADFMGQTVPTSDSAYYVGGRWIPKPIAAPTEPAVPASLPVTVSEAEVQAQGQPEPENEKTEEAEGKVIKLSVFEDWVDGELNIQDTEIGEFIVFPDKTAVEDFVKQYSWNDKFDFQWNCDVLGINIANDYGEEDPAPAVFGTTGTNGNLYFVALSSDGITPDYYQLDSNKDSKPEIIEKKSGEKSVLAVDDWSTDAL